MTAFGDEATAVAALEAGAASYVPKSRQAECLVKTVDRILEHALAGRNRERLGQCLIEYHCRFTLPNDAKLIRALVDELQQTMAGMGFGDTVERIRMAEALEEALLNAMYHGNLEISGEELAKVRAQLDERLLSRLVEERSATKKISDRTILVVAHITPKEARFVVRDQGRGFNLRFADAGAAGDHFEGGNNRGLVLMRAMMDDVSFNEAGNELTLKKYHGAAAVAAGKPR
jgi:anti-sigma regulatory factor (Ser/Thr protein kinase)